MSILIICHPPSLAASRALARAITARDDGVWDIDNKYYTARVDVTVRQVEQGQGHGQAQGQEVDLGDAMVVIWAFTTSAHATPPPTLPSLLAAHPSIDLLYSARLPTREHFDPETDADAADTFHAEYMDLSSLDDPAASSPALRDLRDALQTVPWPAMVRKPLAPQRDTVRAARETGAVEDEGGDEDVDWTREEQVLNAWLDGQDEAFPPIRQDAGTATFEDDFHPSASSRSRSRSRSSEYTPFQSGPIRSPSSSSPTDDPFLPADPAPLLAHLSTIRDHLTTISDADQRRTIAAQHVERLFAGLGIDLERRDWEGA